MRFSDKHVNLTGCHVCCATAAWTLTPPPLPLPLLIFRMNCPVSVRGAPSPARQPKVELHSLHSLKPTASCPLREPPPPWTHTAQTGSPLLMGRLPQLVPPPVGRRLALLHPPLLLMLPRNLQWIYPLRDRRFQMASTRTWTTAAGNQRAGKTSQQCRRCSRLERTLPCCKIMVCKSEWSSEFTLNLMTLHSLFLLLSPTRWAGEVWGPGHHRVYSRAGHGPCQLQRNKVSGSGLNSLSIIEDEAV